MLILVYIVYLLVGGFDGDGLAIAVGLWILEFLEEIFPGDLAGSFETKPENKQNILKYKLNSTFNLHELFTFIKLNYDY